MVSQSLQSVGGKMQKAVEGLKKELATVRTGRATPALVEHIKAEYFGVPTPLNQIAGISAPNARLLVIQPWDKSNIGNIVKAIQASDLGLNPISDGTVIRVNVPPLSEERRQELVRVVRKMVEERKIAIRNLRHEAMGELKELEQSKTISQDEHKRSLNQLQQLTDDAVAEAGKIGENKEAELLQV